MNDKQPPLVSIGMPTYNRADGFLKGALRSALDQTYPDFELIVSNNCSTDHTEEVVKGFNDPRIRYFKQAVNIGSVPNSNFCLSRARGDYFLLHHDDDLIDPDFLETCMKAANYSADAGVILTGTRLIDTDGNIIGETPNTAAGAPAAEFFRGWLARKHSMYLCSTVYNRRRLQEIGGFRSLHNLFDDIVALVRLSEFKRIDIEEVKASFRKHPGEETYHADVRAWVEDSLFLLDVMCEKLPAENGRLREEGMRFLSNMNYKIACSIKSPVRRLKAYYAIFSKYHYRHFPKKRHLLSFVFDLLETTHTYDGARFIKRKLEGIVNR
ncbi:MAG: glycosyltransferase [Nitrospirae bacterium]|nr:glycosyltransferase [Nitrospirota bacterium]